MSWCRIGRSLLKIWPEMKKAGTLGSAIPLTSWRCQFKDSNMILVRHHWAGVWLIFPMSCTFLFNWIYSWISPADSDSLPCHWGGRSASPFLPSGVCWSVALLPISSSAWYGWEEPWDLLTLTSQCFLNALVCLASCLRSQVYLRLGHCSKPIF